MLGAGLILRFCRRIYQRREKNSESNNYGRHPANKGKKVDSVDFQRMVHTFAQTTYSAEFPKINAWFKSVSSSPDFSYIEAIYNRTNQSADISNKLSMGLLGSANNAKIEPFSERKYNIKKKNYQISFKLRLIF